MEGQAPRDVAPAWFKREMNLPITTAPAQIFGGARFHLIVIGVLTAFAATMIAMYFFKMRRAASLLQTLTGSAVTAPAVAAATIASPTSAPQPETRASTTPSVAPPKWSGQLFQRHQ